MRNSILIFTILLTLYSQLAMSSEEAKSSKNEYDQIQFLNYLSVTCPDKKCRSEKLSEYFKCDNEKCTDELLKAEKIASEALVKKDDTNNILLYKSYISQTCKNEGCIAEKEIVLNKCSTIECIENLLLGEELNLQYCSNVDKEIDLECIKKQDAKSALLKCVTNECQDNSILLLKQQIANKEKIPLAEVNEKSVSFRNISIKSLNKKNTLSKINSSAPSNKKLILDRDYKPKVLENSSFRKTPKKTLSNFNNQEDIANRTREMYLEKCTDEKCKDLVNQTFGDTAPKAKLTPEEIIQRQQSIEEKFKDSTIPEQVKQIYLSDGPYSEKMFSYFKENPEIIDNSNFALPKVLSNCNANLFKAECEWLVSNQKSLTLISRFFSNNKKYNNLEGFKFAKETYSQKISNKKTAWCYIGTTLGVPTLSGKYNTEHSLSVFAYSFSDTNKNCIKEIEKTHLPKLKSHLKKNDNFAAHYYIWTDEIYNSAPPIEFNYNIKGDCSAYIYTPLNTLDSPLRESLENSSRVRITKKHTNVTNRQCLFEAKRNYHLLDASRAEEFIFFNGNSPVIRSPSKFKHFRYNDIKLNNIKKLSLYPMSTRCLLTSTPKLGRYNTPREIETDDNGSCIDICKERVGRLLEYNKKYGEKYKDISCDMEIGYSYNTHKINIYKIPDLESEELKKVCKHYDYRWSTKPVFEFYAKSEDLCFDTGIRGKRTNYKDGYDIKDKDSYEYHNYITSKRNYSNMSNYQYRDIEITFDGKSIYKHKSETTCFAEYNGDIHDRIKSSKMTSPTAKSIKDCMNFCKNTYHPLVVSKIRNQSQDRVMCYLGDLLLNDISTPAGVDPLIVTAPDSKISKEEMQTNYFETFHDSSLWGHWER